MKDTEQLRAFVEENDVNLDRYEAFVDGLNVGIEIESSGVLTEKSEEEAQRWIQEQYLGRRDDDA